MRPVAVEDTSLGFGIVTSKLRDIVQAYTSDPPQDRSRITTFNFEGDPNLSVANSVLSLV
jgi:hypothetical protein